LALYKSLTYLLTYLQDNVGNRSCPVRSGVRHAGVEPVDLPYKAFKVTYFGISRKFSVLFYM